ncbi:MAG TPA: class I SAM-dependent methyltransferase [Pyrinomonadaceae bacterium]|jgi:2-polyprenyl-3-methyl-5-hydroxy-6-metoxy-1,4-benzoquinol methylase|nr:class I SAM-dependent methyltransferase [Pyrinomonadaceae bacterium]
MATNHNKAVWDELGERDPYYAVVTHDEFRRSNIDADAKAEFFRMGREHLDEIWPEMGTAAGGGPFRPNSAIDYGCGVGRVLIPLAERCCHVTGVDISHAMLDEARRNAKASDLTNIDYQDADEFSGAGEENYDLVHSFIVLQHIPPPTGYEIIGKLTARLAAGGVGMIHVTYKNAAPLFTRLRFRLYRDVPGVHRLSNLLQRRDFPFMPMYEYDLDEVKEILQSNSCEIVSEKDTDHGFLGQMIFFAKSRGSI